MFSNFHTPLPTTISRMRSLYVLFSFIVLRGVIDEVIGREGRIIGKQIETKIYPGQHFLSTKTPITDHQNITWYKNFPVQGSFYFAGEAQYEKGDKIKTIKFDWKDKLDMCEELGEQTFADLAGQILRLSWLPTGYCPVYKGTYQLRNPFGPKLVDLPYHINSPRYVLKLDVGFSKSSLVFSTTYEIRVLAEETTD